jgi:CheY-like chemotaxis protein
MPSPAAPEASPTVIAARRDGDVAVLLVDDDAEVRVTTAELLRQQGFRVCQAASGPVALDLLTNGFEAHVVLTDVAMPRMSGPALARAIAAKWPRLPVVFFSGYAEPESVAGAAGLKHLVRKPFRPADLVAQLEAALAEACGASAPAE